jgi:Rrf2 family protein
MQIALGRKGDYAVRAVLDLARHYGGPRRKSREIAADMEIPERYLPQILALLVRAGVLAAVAGPDGGYSLARDPSQVSLLEVVEVAEGPVRAMECLLRGGPCDWTGVCPLHGSWSRAQEALAAELARTNFGDLARRDAAIERGDTGPLPPETHRRARGGARGR